MKYCLYAVLILLISCNGLDDNGQEENPVEIIEILLSQAQPALATSAGGEFALYSAFFMQQLAGIKDTPADIDRYNIKPEHIDGAWKSFYLNVFSNLNTIISSSESAGLFKARGIARIMMAHSLGLVSSAWGDIPFSESFLTDRVQLRPSYDRQEMLYQEINLLLEGGIEDLAAYGDQIFPAGHDIYFEGDPDKWIRFARFLALRFNLHTARITGYDLLPLVEYDMFDLPGERLEVNYSDVDNFVHPLFEYLLLHPGSVGAGSFLVDKLKRTGDPRLNLYFRLSGSGEIQGSGPGENRQEASQPSARFISSGSSVILASYTEQEFIKAEIYLRNNLMADAIASYNQGLRSALEDHDLSDDDWFEQNIAVGNLTLEQVITAKYLSLFLQPEVWADWRRTGYPVIVAAAGNVTGDRIPRRYPYPQSEYLFNPDNIPELIEITTPVWWDN
jgi:hypothetical protein